MTKVAVVVGSAHGVFKEIEEFRKMEVPFDILAVNDMISRVSSRLKAAVSLHPEKMHGWLRDRSRNGFYDPQETVTHSGWVEWFKHLGVPPRLKIRPTLITDQMFPGQTDSGSSGLFAVKVALLDFGYDRVVLCGVPMEAGRAHINRLGRPWSGADRHRLGWTESEEFLTEKVRSMSGWTAELLGKPTKEWLA